MAGERKEKHLDVYVIPTESPEKAERKKPSFRHVGKEMLRFKIHFFFFLGGLANAIPFLVVFAKERLGLAASSLGAVLTAQMFIFIFTKPLIGYIADYFNKLKIIIIILTSITVTCYFLLLLIPKFEQEGISNPNVTAAKTAFIDMKLCSKYKEHFGNSFSSADCSNINNNTDALDLDEECVFCSLDTDSRFSNEINSNNFSVLPNSGETNLRTISDFETYQFWMFALFFSMASICSNATFTLSDTACCESVQRKAGAEYGKQRLWGAIDWGGIAPIAGYINDYTGDFLASWTLMAIMLFLFLWNLTKIDLVKPHFSKNILGDVGTAFKSKVFLAYEFVICMNGVAAGIIWFYLLWFLIAIGGSEFLCGLSLAVQNFGGVILFMFFSDYIIRKVGHYQVLSFSLLLYVARCLWYSYLYNPWLVLPIELCHGVTYGLYYTTLASYGKLSAKPGTEATTQSVVFSTHEGLGAGLGCVFGGLGFDYLGGHQTFRIAGIFCACGFLVSLVLFFFIRKENSQWERPASDTSA
ncbi:MFS_1_like domain-containing protein [Caerostris darwini]|uniref:MFS_1_like domain-containing protein n=1 Tax=Caerostris darwini TaxID=1538125 RepID=A0AAV4Q121_9ARAC|nr:MFS_1_like domain-containing protein [Caerostris darwini]